MIRNEVSEVARMRTIKEAIAEIKANDPETAVTENFIKGLCRQGIASVKVGRKYLVNLDLLEQYLFKGETPEPPKTDDNETVRAASNENKEVCLRIIV